MLAKHTKGFNLVDTLSVGVDRVQRNFEPMQRQVESWRQTQITLPEVHRLYFEPKIPELLAANDMEPFERVHQCIQET